MANHATFWCGFIFEKASKENGEKHIDTVIYHLFDFESNTKNDNISSAI